MAKNSLRIKEKNKEYREKNKERLYAMNKKYREENQERLKQIRIENKDVVREREKRRLANDPFYKLKKYIRNSFNDKLRSKGLKKERSEFGYTGITMEEYYEHLRKDPLWGDYINKLQDIHIDHIIACSQYDFSDPEEIKKCWNPKNLRLLPAKENESKHKNLDLKLVDFYDISYLLPKKVQK